jgi:hypothetical protein
MRKFASLEPKFAAHSLAQPREQGRVIHRNHFSSETKISPEVQSKIARLGLERVAGNTWACPSRNEFWQVRGNKIIKLVVDEVDDGSSIAPAPKNDAMGFLEDVLQDLTL